MITSLCCFCVGEKLAEGIQNVFVLLSDEALLLTAAKEFVDVTPQGSKHT